MNTVDVFPQVGVTDALERTEGVFASAVTVGPVPPTDVVSVPSSAVTV